MLGYNEPRFHIGLNQLLKGKLLIKTQTLSKVTKKRKQRKKNTKKAKFITKQLKVVIILVKTML